MYHADTLLTFAEVSVAFAGFAGLVALFGERSRDIPKLLLARRLWGMIELALLVLVFSLLPVIAGSFGLPGSTVWRVASGLLAIALVLEAVHAAPRLSRLTREGVAWGGPVYRLFLLAGLIVPVVVLVANASGFFPVKMGPVYVAVLGAMLAGSAILFVRLLSALVPEEPPSSGAA